MSGESTEPRRLYRERLADRLLEVERQRRTEARLSMLRLILFLAGAALVWPTLFTGTASWIWIALVALAFVVIAVVHDRVIRRRTAAERAADFYRRGLARLDDQWAGKGNPGAGFIDERHPYASDLDLFGAGSLFELLCTARTGPGERTLADWLREPATPDAIGRRQEAIDELRPRVDLREDLAVLGEDLREAVDAEALIAWGRAAPMLAPRWPAIAAAILGLANLTTLVAWLSPLLQSTAYLMAGSLPFWISALFSTVLVARYRRHVMKVLDAVDRPERELELLSELLSRLERERFASPLLVELRSALDTAGQPPSRRIARLARLVEINYSRDNMIFRPFAALALLGTQLAFAMERWRSASGEGVERWLRATGEMEALCALAGYAYEHPDDPFPEVVEDGPCLEGEGLGHPLLPDDRNVRNDLGLGDVRLMIVSGSNMSGKSTLLRTVGVNAVLALTGAPVRATRLRLSPLAVGACMRVQDSLQLGMSHFYAEIKRLRQLVDLGKQRLPMLFLLDEVLHGTNSHDRRIGAAALIRGLVDAGGIGLVTTHDLALARIAEDLGPRASNVHFEDHLEGERIAFDYRLRAGVVRKSNALALMRAVGLEV